MTVNRTLPTTTTDPSGISGEAYAGQVAEEVEALWRIACEPLTNVGGTANAITADTLLSNLAAYEEGNMFSFVADGTNTSSTVTINIDGRGAKRIKTETGADPEEGRIAAGTIYLIQYDGTNFRILNARNAEGANIFEVEPTSDQNTITQTGLSQYTDVELTWAVRVNAYTIIYIDARASGGTWRRILAWTSGNGADEIDDFDMVGWARIVNFGRVNNIKLAVGSVSGVGFDSGITLDRSNNVFRSYKDRDESNLLAGGSTFTEQFDEVRLVAVSTNFEGSDANQRSYLRVRGVV